MNVRNTLLVWWVIMSETILVPETNSKPDSFSAAVVSPAAVDPWSRLEFELVHEEPS